MMWRDQARKYLDVLLIEDNPAEVLLLQEVLAESGVALKLRVAMDGESGLAQLRRGQETLNDRPDLIMLDLNLPDRDGRQLLQEIKEDPKLKSIPVIVLSTSQAEEDIRQCYQLQANCYISKPVDLEDFIAVLKTIESFWFHTVRLPPR